MKRGLDLHFITGDNYIVFYELFILWWGEGGVMGGVRRYKAGTGNDHLERKERERRGSRLEMIIWRERREKGEEAGWKKMCI